MALNKWIQAGLSHQIHLLIIACSEIDMRPAHCEVRIQCQIQLYGMATDVIGIWKCCSVPSIHPDVLLGLIVLFREPSPYLHLKRDRICALVSISIKRQELLFKIRSKSFWRLVRWWKKIFPFYLLYQAACGELLRKQLNLRTDMLFVQAALSKSLSGSCRAKLTQCHQSLVQSYLVKSWCCWLCLTFHSQMSFISLLCYLRKWAHVSRNDFVCFRGQDKFVPGHGEQCQNILHCPEGKKEKQTKT